MNERVLRSVKDSANTYSVASVDRAVMVLEAFDGQGDISLANIGRATGLSDATALRYLGSLVQRGFVEQDEVSGYYRIGMRLIQFGLRARDARPISQQARPWMKRLHERFHETVNLGARHADQVIVIDAIESPRSIRKGANVGEPDCWHASSLGKAILAFLPEQEAFSIVERHGLSRFTPHTRTSHEDLWNEIRRIRQCGYAVDDEESEEGQRCVGAPIFDRHGGPCYAISVSGPSRRLMPETIETMAMEVRSAVTAISARLGYTETSPTPK